MEPQGASYAVSPSGDEASIWEEFRDELASYHFLQTDEISQVAINRTDESDLFTVEELATTVSV